MLSEAKAITNTDNTSISTQDRGRTAKTDPMDLRLDIERRKRFSGKEPGQQQRDGGKGSQGPSQERSSEKSAKHHKKSK